MSASSVSCQKYVLGLDLGSASLGWAVVALNDANEPTHLIRTGVRIFEPGVEGTTADIAEGKDQSKAVDRRTARLHRRQLRRRAARQRDLFKLLQQQGFLPVQDEGSTSASEERHNILNDLDSRICAKWSANSDTDSFAQLPLYKLRKTALDEKLEPFEIGRILYHLSQRRGFKSNRRDTPKNADEEKEQGRVKTGISELQSAMEQSGARTLGEYLASLDPHKVGENVRRRWTSRSMYECEFNQIWEAQIAYYPESLTPALQKQIGLLLFFQRPIAAQGHLIGKCELEPNERRASWATLEAQRFRILQKVNDLQIIYPGNPISQPLTSPEREFVFNLLDSEGDQTFANIRKHLQLDKKSVFNLERGDEKRLRGNRTNVVMRQAFAERWGAFSEEERKQIVEEWRTSESDEWLAKRGVDHWGLGPEIAATWSTKHPENGYCALSRKAIARLMPLMSEGVSFKTAETQLYGDRFSGATALDQLPVVKQYLTTLRNPAVERALTEMRKVVNAIVREYGKPYEIRIELARELKKPRQERVSATKANRKRQKEREDIMQRILQECGIPKERQSRKDIEKALLHVECGGMCPYTGRSIRFSDLFHDSQFDVEHIIPRSRYPDDSFQNKTLCYLPDNRERKRNKTPFEAYGSNEQEWAEILERVRKFGNAGKLKRFMLETLKDIEDFSARQMNDTRYASVLAGRLLGTLYGGRDVQGDVGMRQAVFVSSGAVTATLRRSWGLEAILHDLVPDTSGQGKGKPRTDHRHHAIDAIVIALTRQGMIQQMARAASTEPWQDGERTWRKIESPWRDFVDSIRPHIAELVVSHRPEHKMSGELHKGTNYSVPHLHKGKLTVHTRCALSALCAADIAAEDVIVDVAVRDAIRKKLDELGGSPKLFEKVENTPYLAARDGRQIPIRKVRIRETKNALQIGHGATARLVASGGIHHVAMFVTRDKKRCEVWKSNVVQITDIYQKLPRHDRRKGRPKSPSQGPVVFRGFPDDPDAQFVFSLMKDDTVALDVNGQARIFRVKKFSDNGQIWFVPANDAHDNATQMKSGITWSKKPNTLKELHPRKVVVDLLGKVHTAND